MKMHQMRQLIGRLITVPLALNLLALPAWSAFDMTGTEQRVSIYGTSVASGDMNIRTDTAGSLKVHVASSSATGSSALQVQGTAASGSPAIGNPVLVGGQQSGTNGVQVLHVGPAGDLFVTLQASSSVIGTVTQGASTSLPWTAMLTNGSGVQQGTAAAPLAVVGQATGAIGAGNLAAIGVADAAGNVVAPRAGLDNSLFVTVQASSSTIGGVNQAASASLPWTAMLTNGSGVQQGTTTNPLAIVGQATGSIGSANLAAIGAVNSAGAVVAPRTGLDNSLFVTVQASDSTVGRFKLTDGTDVAMLDGNGYLGVIQGTATVSAGAWPMKLTDGVDTASVDVNGYVGVTQGTATASAGAWPVKITDGTDTASVDVNGYIGVTQGTATVSAGAWPMKLTDGVDTASVDVNGYVGVTQGTATASAGAWPVKITDGTDTALVDANGYLLISQGTATASAGAWVVVGTSTGSVGSASGLLTTGRDSAGAAQPIKVDTTGAPQVDIESGPTGASALQAQGAAASGSAATGNPMLVGGQQSGTNGVQTLHVGPAGDLFVTLQASSSTIGNVGIVSGSAEIGQVAQGTATVSAGAWPVKLTDGTDTALIDANGYLIVSQGTATGSAWTVTGSSTGSVGSSNGLLTTGRDSSGNAQPFKLDTGGALQVDVESGSITVSGTVTANQGGAPWSVSSSGTFPVTQNASGSLPWLAMLSNGSGVQQGTSTNPLGVIGTSTGSVGSANGLLAAGRDSAGNAQPLRMATDGTVRTDPTGVTTQPVSGTFWQATQPVSGTVTANIGASTSLPVLVTQTSPDGTRVTEDWRTPAVSVISVGTSATQLIPSSPAKMVGACFQPLSGVIYIAESTISSAVTYPGLKLAQDTIFCPDMYAGGAWYGIATPSAVTTAVMTSVSAQ